MGLEKKLNRVALDAHKQGALNFAHSLIHSLRDVEKAGHGAEFTIQNMIEFIEQAIAVIGCDDDSNGKVH